MKEILDNTAAVERIAVNLEIINDSGDYFILQRILNALENFEAPEEFRNLWRISKSLENFRNSGEYRYFEVSKVWTQLWRM